MRLAGRRVGRAGSLAGWSVHNTAQSRRGRYLQGKAGKAGG